MKTAFQGVKPVFAPLREPFLVLYAFKPDFFDFPLRFPASSAVKHICSQ
jgi:hypothetical protein